MPIKKPVTQVAEQPADTGSPDLDSHPSTGQAGFTHDRCGNNPQTGTDPVDLGFNQKGRFVALPSDPANSWRDLAASDPRAQ